MTDDAELLAGSDADSFAEFYRRHARRLAGWLMRMTGDAEVAADLTAETFAAALVGRASYGPERGAPATWLYGIAAHKLSDWRRRGSAEDRFYLVPTPPEWEGGRVNWLDENGVESSRGHELLPR